MTMKDVITYVVAAILAVTTYFLGECNGQKTEPFVENSVESVEQKDPDEKSDSVRPAEEIPTEEGTEDGGK